MNAVIAGATGLVGRELVRLVLSSDYYDKITILSRRPLKIKDNRLDTVIVQDFDQLKDYADKFDVEDVYCCLGTTMKKAGSKEVFRKIDFDYPIEMAKLAKTKSHFKRFLVVTAVGSNSESCLFYNQVKGQLEDALVAMDLPSLHIFQPSLLIGARDEWRWGEEVAKFFSVVLSFFMVGWHKSLWSIRGSDVAQAMFMVARKGQSGIEKYKPHKMLKLLHS
ncbi:MAG: NAD(P)H-binding protein [Cyclobacteriaceae bacterium]|nr:NAD(P)H-binding protein [Cyclobacteriaceae bacterium HetDA_MAG_MS6]